MALQALDLFGIANPSPCPSTSSFTATTIKSQSSSNLELRPFMLGYELRLMGLDQGEFTEGPRA
jgi:hypothetical protein